MLETRSGVHGGTPLGLRIVFSDLIQGRGTFDPELRDLELRTKCAYGDVHIRFDPNGMLSFLEVTFD